MPILLIPNARDPPSRPSRRSVTRHNPAVGMMPIMPRAA